MRAPYVPRECARLVAPDPDGVFSEGIERIHSQGNGQRTYARGPDLPRRKRASFSPDTGVGDRQGTGLGTTKLSGRGIGETNIQLGLER